MYQFDRTGHFLHKIGAIGNGPGEYNSILDVSVNEKFDRIFIADYVGKKIVIYNLSGEYIGQYLYDFYALHIEAIDNCLLFSLLNMFGTDANKLIVRDLEGKPVVSSSNNNLFTATDNFITPKVKSFQKYKDELLFRQSFNDTIYSFEPKSKKLDVRYVFDFEEAKLPVDLLGSYEQFSREQSNYAYLDDITETNDHLFVSMVFKGKGEKHYETRSRKKRPQGICVHNSNWI